MLDLTPTAPAAYYERPRGGSNVSKGASARVYACQGALSL
jgi:hypothetical protein